MSEKNNISLVPKGHEKYRNPAEDETNSDGKLYKHIRTFSSPDGTKKVKMFHDTHVNELVTRGYENDKPKGKYYSDYWHTSQPYEEAVETMERMPLKDDTDMNESIISPKYHEKINKRKRINEMTTKLKEGTAADSLAPNSMPADGKTKAGMMASMMGAMNGMSKSELVDFFNASMAQFGPNVDLGIPNGAAQKNLASITTKTVKEDVNEIFTGNEELTEDFKDKVSTLIESAVNSRLALEITSIQEENETVFNEMVDDYKQELAEQIEEYLNFAAKEWVENNKPIVENTLKIEVQESFMNGLKHLFTEHYVDMPNEKYNLVGDLQASVKEIKEELNNMTNVNATLKATNDELNCQLVAIEMSNGLTESEIEKFFSLSEGLTYSDLDNYKTKLQTIKETYFTNNVNKATIRNTEQIMGIPLVEENESVPVTLNGPMALYAKAISKSTIR